MNSWLVHGSFHFFLNWFRVALVGGLPPFRSVAATKGSLVFRNLIFFSWADRKTPACFLAPLPLAIVCRRDEVAQVKGPWCHLEERERG